MTNAQWIALYTILRREIGRVFRIWKQTLLPPVITQSLYFIVFGTFIGSQIEPIKGISYMAYIVPGIVMMSVITSAYSNVVFSFFSAKFMRNVDEMLVSPMSYRVLLGGYVLSGIARAFITGALVFIVSLLYVRTGIAHPLTILIFTVLTSALFSLGGFLNALFAQSFDDAGPFTTFVLTPLTYLGGVFYSVDQLPPFFKTLSYANPMVYMVDGIRYGFYGVHDTNLWAGAGLLFVVIAILIACNMHLLKKGTGLRS